MIYVQFKSETETRAIVNFIHYKPFDPVDGMGKTKEQLEQTGAVLGTLPEQQAYEGKRPVLYINPQTKETWYEYVDIPLPTEERIAELEKLNKDLMLASTDLYEQNLALEEKNKTVMLATTDLYEQNIDLETRIKALEGGAV